MYNDDERDNHTPIEKEKKRKRREKEMEVLAMGAKRAGGLNLGDEMWTLSAGRARREGILMSNGLTGRTESI